MWCSITAKVPEPRTETETINELMIRSYVIPVVQERPSRSVEQEVLDLLDEPVSQ